MFACFIVKGFGQISGSGSASITAGPITKSFSLTTVPTFSPTTVPTFSPTTVPTFSPTLSTSSTVSSSFSPSITQSASLSYVYTSTYIMWPSSSFSPSISQNPTYSSTPLISSSPSVSSTMSQSVTVLPISPSVAPSPNQWFDSLANYQQMLVAFAMLVGGCICFILLYNCYLKLTNPPNVSKAVVTRNTLPIGRGYEHQNVRRLFSEV